MFINVFKCVLTLMFDSSQCFKRFSIIELSGHVCSPFSIRYSHAICMCEVSILHSPFSIPNPQLSCFLLGDSVNSQFLFSCYLGKCSLRSQFAILRLSSQRCSPFSIRNSHAARMNIVSIFNFILSV